MTISRQLLPLEDGALPLTVAEDGGAGASLVVMPSAFGIGRDLESQMSEIASHARLVVALDPFFRTDGGPAPYDDMKRVVGRITALHPRRAYADLKAAIDWTRSHAPDRSVTVLGICFGGAHALHAAADGVASGVVTWHATRIGEVLDRASEVRCPVRMHFGAADPFVPFEVVEAVRVAFSAHDDARVIMHPGATHGFTHRDAPQAYDSNAERAAMESAYELIERVGQ
jgi:carboxymethylenebutenolidase